MIHLLKYVILMLTIIGCQDTLDPGTSLNPNPSQTSEWLIPKHLVFDGGPGKDGIPSIDNPRFSNIEEINFLDNTDLVILVEVGGVVRGYPQVILDWHEIVNDRPGLLPLSITYCPLTGTAIGWKRMVNGAETEFGVSGLLYNSNLMPYDRKTNSTWSQIRQDCVNGELISTKAEQYPVTEIEWGLLKSTMPEVMILNTDTGFSRNYGRYPYGDYKVNNNRLLFPVTEEDNRIPQKERVLAIISEDTVKVYRFSSFKGNGAAIKDVFDGIDIIVVGNQSQNYMVAFEIPAGLELTFLSNKFPYILQDQEGIEYDIFGNAADGTTLKHPVSFIGYWFSFPAFFEDVEIYE